MRPEILMGVAGYAVLIAAQKRASQDIRRRAGELCEVTYGAGSVQCADEQGTLCYNPSLGQSCCASDTGYCDKGEYCSPVAGFCCVDGDDPDTCIQNTSVSVQAESNANQTLSKTDTPAAGTLPAVGSFETRDELSGEGNPRRTKVTTPLRTTPGNSNSHAQVQVSVAKKGQWRLLLMGAAIGAVGIFMSSC